MARFERENAEAATNPASLDAAADELESFVENQVRGIIDAAESRAAEIESAAAERARDIESEAERKSEQMLEEAFTRAWRILDGIDLLENGVGDMIGALRAEMEGLAADLGSVSPADEHSRPAVTSPPAGDASGRRNGAVQPVEHDGTHVEVEQMIVEQVAILFREGRSRADAERFVMRFKRGEDYLHVLDLVYREDGDDPAAPDSRPSPARRFTRGFRARRG